MSALFYDGTVSSMVAIDILGISGGMVPQVEIAWNGKNNWRCFTGFEIVWGSLRLLSLLTMNRSLICRSSKKLPNIHQVKPPFDVNLAKFWLNFCAIPGQGWNESIHGSKLMDVGK